MAHELTQREDGSVEFVGNVTRGVPWHRLGQRVEEDMTVWSALQKAQLDWQVEQESLFLVRYHSQYAEDHTTTEIPDRVANVRSDNGEYLGTVGTGYVPIQNHETAEFIEALTGEGAAVVDCCGSIRGGRRIFWTCKVPGEMIVGDDKIDRYLILANGHDGSLAFKAFWSPVRVVCSNTLSFALHGSKRDGISLRHSKNVKSRVEEAQRILGLTDAHYESLAQQFDRLVQASITDEDVNGYFETVVPDNDEAERHTRTENVRRQLRVNYRSPREAHTRGTVWGAYNAVTEYTSHQMTVRKVDGEASPEKRFESVLFGSAKNLQQRAFSEAMKLSA